MVLTCLAIVVMQAGVEARLQEVLPLHGLQLLHKLLLLRPELRQGPGHLRLWEEENVSVMLACRRRQDLRYRLTTWTPSAPCHRPVAAQLMGGCGGRPGLPAPQRVGLHGDDLPRSDSAPRQGHAWYCVLCLTHARLTWQHNTT